VTSVAAVTPWARPTRAATSLSVVIDAIAASISAALAASALIAWPMMPVPSGLVSTSACPGRAPVLAHTASSATSPVTDSPNFSSGSRTV